MTLGTRTIALCGEKRFNIQNAHENDNTPGVLQKKKKRSLSNLQKIIVIDD